MGYLYNPCRPCCKLDCVPGFPFGATCDSETCITSGQTSPTGCANAPDGASRFRIDLAAMASPYGAAGDTHVLEITATEADCVWQSATFDVSGDDAFWQLDLSSGVGASDATLSLVVDGSPVVVYRNAAEFLPLCENQFDWVSGLAGLVHCSLCVRPFSESPCDLCVGAQCWEFTIAGVADSQCDNCDCFNGSYTLEFLDAVVDSLCLWGAQKTCTPCAHLPASTRIAYLLYLSEDFNLAVLMAVRLSGDICDFPFEYSSLATWNMPLIDFDCDGENELGNMQTFGPGCTSWPATVTLTPTGCSETECDNPPPFPEEGDCNDCPDDMEIVVVGVDGGVGGCDCSSQMVGVLTLTRTAPGTDLTGNGGTVLCQWLFGAGAFGDPACCDQPGFSGYVVQSFAGNSKLFAVVCGEVQVYWEGGNSLNEPGSVCVCGATNHFDFRHDINSNYCNTWPSNLTAEFVNC